MPKKEESALRAIARKKGFGKQRTNAFVYGIMRKNGWKPRKKGKK